MPSNQSAHALEMDLGYMEPTIIMIGSSTGQSTIVLVTCTFSYQLPG